MVFRLRWLPSEPPHTYVGMTIFDTAAHPRETVSGQFIDKAQSAPELRLAADGMNAVQRAQRHAALEESGFIPAVSGSAERSGTTRSKVGTWWDSHFVRAEYRPDDAGYPQMPDDFTPSQTGGRALSGSRRTHRMSYAGPDVTVRMPSATSIKRYARETGQTFDVPVTATFPGGNISGWVRVTQNGPNEWSAQGLNFPGGDAVQVAEAVGAVLESRRPRNSLHAAGDLLARRAERIASAGERIQESSKSSFVTGAGYDRSRGVLAVKIGDRVYGYKASLERVRAFSAATSVGQAYNRLVKGTQVSPVIECAKCHRFNVEGQAHRCPSRHREPAAGPVLGVAAARAAAKLASARG